MSNKNTQDQDAALGRLVWRHTKNRKLMKELTDRCHWVGRELTHLGEDLMRAPESIKAMRVNQNHCLRGTQASRQGALIDAQFEGGSVAELLEELRKARAERDILKRELKTAGLEDDDIYPTKVV